jgi:hypothetical protein
VERRRSPSATRGEARGEIGSLGFVATKLREAAAHLCGEDLPADA